MSYQPLWLRDLVAYSLQAAALVGVGVVMARLIRLRVPRVRMVYWQGLVTLCLFLPLLQPWRPEVLETSGTMLSNVTLAPSAPVAVPTLSPAEIVLLLICVGIMVRAAWMALGMVRLWFYRREAQRIQEVPQAVAEAGRLVPVSAALFVSSRLQTPATFGYFRPAILFPARFLEMEPSMQKAIALHELLHVERRDWLWNLLEETVLTLLWFHLPLWWAVRSIRLSREQVVDAEAVRRGKARRPYLKALLEIAGQKRLAESLPAALFLRESQLAERVALMMKEVHMSRKQLTVSILSAAGVLLIAGASMVWAFPLKTSATQAATQASLSASRAEVSADASASGGPAITEAGSAENRTKVYEVGGDVTAPEPLDNPDPPYTPQARKNHLAGAVVLSCVVDPKGKVSEITEQSRPLGEGLDESAINTVRSWRFKPGTRNGVPVPVRVMVEITFKLYGKAAQASAKTDPHSNPQPQVKQPAPEASKKSGLEIKLNQAEIQRQVEQAMKQAEKAQKAAAKIDQAKVQKQIDEAMKQARIAQQAAEKLNSAEMQRKLQEAMKQAEKLNAPEMQRQLKQALEQAKIARQVASKIDQAKIQKQVEEAMKQAKIAQQAASKVDQAKIQKQVEEAMKQLKAAKIAAPKIDEAEIQRQVEQAMKEAQTGQKAILNITRPEFQRQIERLRRQAEIARQQAEEARQAAEIARKQAAKARKDAAAARAEAGKFRKEAEKARKQAGKDRLKSKEQQKELKPLPAEPPAPPAPPSSKDLPSSPPPPQPQN